MAEIKEKLLQRKGLTEEQKEKVLAAVRMEEEIKWREYKTALKVRIRHSRRLLWEYGVGFYG